MILLCFPFSFTLVLKITLKESTPLNAIRDLALSKVQILSKATKGQVVFVVFDNLFWLHYHFLTFLKSSKLIVLQTANHFK